jgi:Ca2+/Na+ antiporter
MQLLIPMMGHVYWFATPENDWANLICPYVPSWMGITDKTALMNHYKGGSTFYTFENFHAWLIPILAWSAFVLAFVMVMLMINILVRRQWVEVEKLTYPIIQLPLRMINEPLSLFRNKLFWTGFAIAAGLDILNQLHFMFPNIPGVHLKMYDLQRYFTDRPWSGIGWFPISFYPWVIGLGFLIPLDLLFSCWFFYLFWKAQRVIIFAFGLSSRGGAYAGYQSMIEQSAGAYIGLFFIVILANHRYIIRIFKCSLGLEQIDQSNEPMSYRLALLILALSFLFLVGFSATAGMSVWLAVVFFVLYFMVDIAVTRMRVEMGVPIHDIHNGGPDLLLPPTLGTRRLGVSNLTIMSMYWWFNRTHYSDPMPHQLEEFKLAEQTKTNNRKMLFVIIFSVILSIFATFWSYVDPSHRVGMEEARMNWVGQESMDRLQNWLMNPIEPSSSTAISFGVGMVFTLFLASMRMRFLWWPFHPAGYAVSNSWGMSVAWFPLFIAWFIKSLVMRFGGLKLLRQLTPLFMGLMLGEFVIGSSLSVVGTALGKLYYSFWVY